MRKWLRSIKKDEQNKNKWKKKDSKDKDKKLFEGGEVEQQRRRSLNVLDVNVKKRSLS